MCLVCKSYDGGLGRANGIAQRLQYIFDTLARCFLCLKASAECGLGLGLGFRLWGFTEKVGRLARGLALRHPAHILALSSFELGLSRSQLSLGLG